jgi:acyl-coenzyme A thioesterase PaaI-like protein
MENFSSRMKRWLFNFFPAFRSTGAWVTYISSDFREIHVRMSLNWRTRNYVGTLFGGALYSAIDGIPMVMLINLLGKEYIVWDKSAQIRFLKPGRDTVTAVICISEEETTEIQQAVDTEGKIERSHTIEWKNRHGDVIAVVDQLIHIRAKNS